MSRLSALLALFALATPLALDGQTMRSDGAIAPPLLGFGMSVAVSEGRVFVGRTQDFGAFAMPPDGPGSVHVFEQAGGGWTETATLAVDGLSTGSAFGHALAARGATVLVGAPNAADARGRAFVFERTAAGWALAQQLEPSSVPGDSAGYAVALAGDVALLGAPGGGTVFVFRYRDGRWREAERLTAPEAIDGARFGAAVALGDGVAAVAAPGPAPASILAQFTGFPTYQPGRVHVYRMGPAAYALEASLQSPDSTVRAFGTALVFTEVDNVLVAGAPVSGHVVPFAFLNDRWSSPGAMSPSAPAGGFGSSLAVAGLDLLVGAPGSQKVFVYHQDGMGSDAQTIAPDATFHMMPTFGASVAAGGDVAVVGAPGEDFFEGVGYVLTRDASRTWSHAARVIDDPASVTAVTGSEMRCEDGSAAGFDCSMVDLVSYLPSHALGADRGIWISDVWGWTDPVTNHEIAIVGRIDGTSFVDLSDPANPVYLGELPLTEGATPNLWRDMKVYRDHAFIVADNAGRHGMQVFDLTRLRGISAPPVTFEPDTTYFEIHSSHNIAINEDAGFAFTVGNSAGGETCGGQAHMVDIRDPKHPAFAGCAGPNSTHTHDLQCVTYDGPDDDYRGRELCFHSAAELLGITDVTVKDSTTVIATATYPNLVYAHQGWLSDDARYFYLNDELDEISGNTDRTRTLIFDVADLDDPVLVTEYLGETGATDHNLYVHGQYLYESNYVAGLRVLDISNPEQPVEIGYFDTVRGGANTAGFAGSWSNYPYFASGIVVVTSIREGLFVLRPQPRVLVP